MKKRLQKKKRKKKRLHGLSSRLTLQKERIMNRLAIETMPNETEEKRILKK